VNPNIFDASAAISAALFSRLDLKCQAYTTNDEQNKFSLSGILTDRDSQSFIYAWTFMDSLQPGLFQY